MFVHQRGRRQRHREVGLARARRAGDKARPAADDVIAKLLARGVLATINQPLDPEVAIGVAKDVAGWASNGDGTYDVVWWLGVALGLFAAVMHWPIRESRAPAFTVPEAAKA